MAISGDSGYLNTPGMNLNVDQYSRAVGDVQGKTVENKSEYGNLDGLGGEYRSKDYESGTVAGSYVLKGKAGITADFYQKFSDAFDQYKKAITDDLAKLKTNPNIKQAFKGTEIEKAISNLIYAVEDEANDYLFKLERREKTVIESVKQAFQRQQNRMGSSMQSDTSKLRKGNATTGEIGSFDKESDAWYQAQTRTGSN